MFSLVMRWRETDRASGMQRVGKAGRETESEIARVINYAFCVEMRHASCRCPSMLLPCLRQQQPQSQQQQQQLQEQLKQ